MLLNLLVATLLSADPAVVRLAPAYSVSEKAPANNVALLTSGREVIVERFPNGHIKVQREVTQDDHQNFLNHGIWLGYNEGGQEIARGEFVMDKREGPWFEQIPSTRELHVPLSPAAAQFQAPLLSRATFNDGKLQGKWTITDARDRLVMSLGFQDGKRHGRCTWWHSNGTKWREVRYREGLLDGEASEWSPQQQIVRSDVYVGGRLMKTVNEFYSPRVKKLEAQYLGPRVPAGQGDDWWTSTSQPAIAPGGDTAEIVLDGHWISWHPNQQKASEGQYVEGQPENTFTWWHDNGQKACEGSYEHGVPVGPWVWWHTNGQRQIQGAFVAGNQSGNWTWWDVEGQVLNSEMFDERAPIVALTPTLTEQPPTLNSESKRRPLR